MTDVVSLVHCAEMGRPHPTPQPWRALGFYKHALTTACSTLIERRPKSRIITRQFHDYDGFGLPHYGIELSISRRTRHDSHPRRYICRHLYNAILDTASQVPTGLFSEDDLEYSTASVCSPYIRESVVRSSVQDVDFPVVNAPLSYHWVGLIG
jgi:hypothetical protein